MNIDAVECPDLHGEADLASPVCQESIPPRSLKTHEVKVKLMSDILVPLILIAMYIAVLRFVLPALGIST